MKQSPQRKRTRPGKPAPITGAGRNVNLRPCYQSMLIALSVLWLGTSLTHAEVAVVPLAIEHTRQWTEPLSVVANESVVEMTTPTSGQAMSILPPATIANETQADRIWLISTRHLTYNPCRLNLRHPQFRVSRLDRCGRQTSSSVEEFLGTVDLTRPRLYHIHGNRRDARTTIELGMYVYRKVVASRRSDQPIDWVIWSWPSDSETLPIRDARIKAKRADSQGLYLAWLLHQQLSQGQPTALIGFSFGARVVTSSLHSLAGGNVAGRYLGLPPIQDAKVDVGFLAAAVDDRWLSVGGRHQLACQNIDRIVMLYNRKDIALKYFWLISRERGSEALGYTGPRRFAARYDGTPIPVHAKDCSRNIGSHHSEKEYYEASSCRAGGQMASLIHSTLVAN